MIVLVDGIYMMTQYTLRMLFIVSCGTGDVDRRARLFVFMAHDSVRHPHSSLFSLLSHLVVR